MKKFKFYLINFLVILIVLFLPSGVGASYDIEDELQSKAAIVINLDSGLTLFDYNSDLILEPASTTKIMTALVVLEQVEDIYNTEVTVSASAISDLDGTGSSVAGLVAGEVLTVEELLYCLLLPSGNDAALALAYYIGDGDLSVFIEMMNDKALELGCLNTNFTNPHGLHDEEHYTTANDLAIITLAAIEYDVFNEIIGTVSYELGATNKSSSRTFYNSNMMMHTEYGDEYYYPYIVGGKTGSTTPAGYCFVSLAVNEDVGYSYLTVTLGAMMYDDYDNKLSNGAFEDTYLLLEKAFNEYSINNLIEIDDFVCDIAIEYVADRETISVVAGEEYTSLLPIEINAGSIEVVVNDDLIEELEAPIEAGIVVGSANIIYNDEIIAVIDLVTGESLDASSYLILMAKVEKITSSTAFKIVIGIFIFLLVSYIGLYISHRRRRARYRKIREKRRAA